jgi:hypothetical protein
MRKHEPAGINGEALEMGVVAAMAQNYMLYTIVFNHSKSG